MTSNRRYTLEEIADRLEDELFPFSGITAMGSAAFSFNESSHSIGMALHAGSRVRSNLQDILQTGSRERSREEDLFTDLLIRDFPLELVARDSRFEYDLNWEEEGCIYPYGQEKWGMKTWRRPLTRDEKAETHAKYREFHELLDMLVAHVVRRYGSAIVFEVHGFCYQRERQVSWWEDPKPDINLGTRHINRDHFTPQIEMFLQEAAGIKMDGHLLRVAENELFQGGYLTRKYAATHNRQVLVLAIEYKKIYMDERSGRLFPERLDILRKNLLLTKERIPRIRG
jgi:N-formylglutamate amidohydrolase